MDGAALTTVRGEEATEMAGDAAVRDVGAERLDIRQRQNKILSINVMEEKESEEKDSGVGGMNTEETITCKM